MSLRALAKALMQKPSNPPTLSAYSFSRNDTSASGAPPPGISLAFFTRQRTTQRASWIDLSASAQTNWFDPRTKMEQVLPGFFTPVILSTRPEEHGTSSANSACPSISLENRSTDAMGLQPRVLHTNSTSSLSMSV